MGPVNIGGEAGRKQRDTTIFFASKKNQLDALYRVFKAGSRCTPIDGLTDKDATISKHACAT